MHSKNQERAENWDDAAGSVPEKRPARLRPALGHNGRQTMRRTTATTEYLKECMGTALLELMQEKPIEKISIEEMTARADVGRSTYFRYFKTKDEVLVFKIQQLWNRFAQDHNIQDFQANDDAWTAIRLFFEFCLSIRQINDLLYRVGHQQVILDVYLQILRPEKQEEDVIAYYKSNETAYALYGVVNAWILRGYKESPARMGEILCALEGNF